MADSMSPGDDGDDIGNSEKDMPSPADFPDSEAPQEKSSPTLTRPKGMMDKTNESLSLLGAGQPYRSMC